MSPPGMLPAAFHVAPAGALGPVTDPTGGAGLGAYLTQYGVLGVFAAILVVFARAAYKREVARGDDLQRLLLAAYAAVQDRQIPIAEEANRALAETARALQEATIAIRDLQTQRDLERHRRGLGAT